jgi:uncharacterized membrane protein YjjB (DUF3815 family)
MGLGVGGYDIVAALVAAQLALVAIFHRQIAAVRTLSNRLAARAVGFVATLLGRTSAAPATSR